MDDLTEAAARRISEVVLRRRAEPRRPSRPLGLFLLAGAGETVAAIVARAVAESVLGDSRAILRFDMAEYGEKCRITDLVGPPPGIVGYGPPGLLTEPIRLDPDRVVLLERIDRAHPDAQNMLHQIAEEGSLVEARGRIVDFGRAVLLLTTGAGVCVERVLKPELLGLLDGVINFEVALHGGTMGDAVGS